MADGCEACNPAKELVAYRIFFLVNLAGKVQQPNASLIFLGTQATSASCEPGTSRHRCAKRPALGSTFLVTNIASSSQHGKPAWMSWLTTAGHVYAIARGYCNCAAGGGGVRACWSAWDGVA